MLTHNVHQSDDEDEYSPADGIFSMLVETEMLTVFIQTVELLNEPWTKEEVVIKLKDGAMFRFDPAQFQASQFPEIRDEMERTHRLSVLTVEKPNGR